MKTKSLLLSILAMSMMLVGCAKEQTEDTGKASMKLDPAELNFDAAASSKTVKVTCNRDWKVAETDVPEWVSLTVDGKDIKGVSQKASSNPVVTVAVLENTGYERACNIKFNGGSLASKTLTVKQAGNASYTTIAEVRALNPDKSAKVNAPEGTVIKGIVISDATLNNLNSQALVYVQDATAGICIKCSANHSFAFGDEVVVDLSGVSLEYYSNLFQANGAPLDKFSVVSQKNTPEVAQVSVADFLAGKYESRYVELNEDVQVVDDDLSKNWGNKDNHTSINMETKSGSNFVVQSSKYSSYKDTKVSQGSGKIKGIATVYYDKNNNKEIIQLVFAQLSDFAGLTGERFAVVRPKLETEKISEVIAATDNTEVTLKNVTVVAACITTKDKVDMDTFMVEDAEHAKLLVFGAALGTIGEGAIIVGDVVTVNGVRTSYSDTPQIKTPTVTKTGTGSVSYPSAKDISSELDTSKPKVGDYVQFTGNLSISGNYYNVSVDGATKVKGSFNKPKFIDVTSYKDVPNVTYTGYYLYHTNNDQYLYIIVTEVKASDAPYLNVSPEKIDVKANVTSATFDVSSNIESWACTPSTGASVDVTTGSKNQTVKVEFAANTDTENAKTYTVTVTAGEIVKTVTINQAKYVDVGSAKFVKLTAAPTDWSGEYLIVCEEFNFAADGSKVPDGTGLGAKGVNLAVTISEGEINQNVETLVASTVTVEVCGDGYAIKAKSGKYMTEAPKDGTKIKAGLNASDTPVACYLSMTAEGKFKVVSNSKDTHFAINKGSKTGTNPADMFFRFYNKSNFEPMSEQYCYPALYKLVK